MNKTILISIDGMRADGLLNCGNPYLDELTKKSSYSFDAQTVFPSVTLPCHLSMFHSVPPERHGTLNNQYVVPVRPVTGLFESIRSIGGETAMYFGWHPLRDVCRPASLNAAEYINAYYFEHSDEVLTNKAMDFIKLKSPDFVFLYMLETDEKGGHDNGWMTDTYLDYVSRAIDNVKKVIEEVGDEYTVIVTADHGGHDRIHGTDMPEDMTIPMFFYGKDFKQNENLGAVSILDIAPTIASVMGAPVPREWEGKSLVNNR